tara:strand:+ start:145 stop:1461 length:1317 start_codon:yes stop_codon:yes gene_type:complete
MSRTRDIASILGATEAENTTNISLGAGGGGGGATAYDSVGVFPTSGNTAGDLAFATSTKTIHNWDGSAWDKIYSGTNEVPTFDSALPAAIGLFSNGASSIIRFKAATDIEGFPINYNYETSPSFPAQLDSAFGEDSGSGGTGILDSTGHPTDPRITIKPSVVSTDQGSFTLRVKANDGSHVITSSSTVSLSFFDGDYFYIANSSYAASKDTASVTSNFTQGSAVTLATHGGVQGHVGGTSQNGSGAGTNSSLLWDLTNSGGFDATTDLIVTSFYLPSFTSGVTFGLGLYDDTANNGVTFSIYNGNFGIVKSTGSFFDIAALPVSTWIIMAAGGGNSLLSPSGTASSSGLRFWPANTSGGSTLGTEYSAAPGSPGGFGPQTLTGPGIIYYNGGNPTGMGVGNRSAMEYNVRSVQVFYNQTTSGKTIEQIVGAHQSQAFG